MVKKVAVVALVVVAPLVAIVIISLRGLDTALEFYDGGLLDD